jgi:hypothetical protein
MTQKAKTNLQILLECIIGVALVAMIAIIAMGTADRAADILLFFAG